MLNKEGQRELAYIVKIDAIEPIEGSDNCEAAVVGGWRIMVRKGTFKVGDYAVYFEIDSKVPETREYEFLAKKHYKIKTQKYTFGGKGNFISQGLLMHFNDFQNDGGIPSWLVNFNTQCAMAAAAGGEIDLPYFLTEDLGVTYSVADDNKRKASTDKYTKMRARHQKLFRKNKLVQWLWNRNWGKKILFFFLGTKKDKRGWPDWVRKTDEERCQNLPQLFPGDETQWLVTEKIDGSSTTFTLHRRAFGKYDFFVCSRNVCFDTPEKLEKCYYDSNIYLEMAKKYNIEEVLHKLLDMEPKSDFVTLQGETYGDGVQKRTYGLINGQHDFAAFNLIYGTDINNQHRLDSYSMKALLSEYNIPTVPILEGNYKLPATCDELLKYADGISQLDGEIREGVVLRTYDGVNSFKAVSNEFLIKFKE